MHQGQLIWTIGIPKCYKKIEEQRAFKKIEKKIIEKIELFFNFTGAHRPKKR